ncbi:hypothetical protein DL771_004144 [Monosporascus sp. 5C6A]|nr:hypothetical protein DL771_004144 [Monosporascus sp. 5C6A]
MIIQPYAKASIYVLSSAPIRPRTKPPQGSRTASLRHPAQRNCRTPFVSQLRAARIFTFAAVFATTAGTRNPPRPVPARQMATCLRFGFGSGAGAVGATPLLFSSRCPCAAAVATSWTGNANANVACRWHTPASCPGQSGAAAMLPLSLAGGESSVTPWMMVRVMSPSPRPQPPRPSTTPTPRARYVRVMPPSPRPRTVGGAEGGGTERGGGVALWFRFCLRWRDVRWQGETGDKRLGIWSEFSRPGERMKVGEAWMSGDRRDACAAVNVPPLPAGVIYPGPTVPASAATGAVALASRATSRAAVPRPVPSPRPTPTSALRVS